MAGARWMGRVVAVLAAAVWLAGGDTLAETVERSAEERQRAAQRFAAADLGIFQGLDGAVFSDARFGEAVVQALPEEEKLRIRYVGYRTDQGRLRHIQFDLEPLGAGRFRVAVPGNSYGSGVRNYEGYFDPEGLFVMRPGVKLVFTVRLQRETLSLAFWEQTSAGLKEVRLQRDYFTLADGRKIPFDVREGSDYQRLVASHPLGTWQGALGQRFVAGEEGVSVVASEGPAAFALDYTLPGKPGTSTARVSLPVLRSPASGWREGAGGSRGIEAGVLPSGLLFWSVGWKDSPRVYSTFLKNHGDRVVGAWYQQPEGALLSKVYTRVPEAPWSMEPGRMALLRGVHRGLAEALLQQQRAPQGLGSQPRAPSAPPAQAGVSTAGGAVGGAAAGAVGANGTADRVAGGGAQPGQGAPAVHPFSSPGTPGR